MVENHIIKRGGKEWDLTIGVTPEGDTVIYKESVNPEPNSGQKTKRFPLEFKVTFNEGDGDGTTTQMEVKWKEVMLDNNGNPIHPTGLYQTLRVNREEITEFIMAFADPILRYMENGDFRANLGFNELPVFDATGAVIVYTEEQLNQPPTFDYYGAPPTE